MSQPFFPNDAEAVQMLGGVVAHMVVQVVHGLGFVSGLTLHAEEK
jgi:hypothetical protein